MKQCIKCNEKKQPEDFYKHKAMSDGRLGKCKVCCRSDARANRKDKAEYYRAYDRQRGYREYSPEKAKARRAVRQLKRPAKCSSCKAVGAVEAHHKDYSKALDVVWLCKQCHARLHVFERETNYDNGDHHDESRSSKGGVQASRGSP